MTESSSRNSFNKGMNAELQKSHDRAYPVLPTSPYVPIPCWKAFHYQYQPRANKDYAQIHGFGIDVTCGLAHPTWLEPGIEMMIWWCCLVSWLVRTGIYFVVFNKSTSPTGCWTGYHTWKYKCKRLSHYKKWWQLIWQCLVWGQVTKTSPFFVKFKTSATGPVQHRMREKLTTDPKKEFW